MITVEFWGPAKSEYGPVLRKNSEQTKVPMEQAYQLAKTEDSTTVGGFIRILVNGKWVPSYYFIQQYEQTHSKTKERPNITIFREYPSNLFVAVDTNTKKDLFKGDEWAMEKWLDVNGYFQDDEVKFEV